MRIAASVLLSVLSIPAAAQIQMTETSRNELLEISLRDREAYHYRRVCQSSAVDTATEFDKARAALGFGYSSRDEYCSSEASKFKNYAFDYLRTSIVVEKAFQVWSECYRLNRAGVIATPIVESERVTLTLQRGSVPAAMVNWIKTTAGTKCFGKLGGGKFSEIKADVHVALSDAEPWTLVCERGALNTAAMITVDTTAGPFQIKLPAELHVQERWASRLEARLAAVENSIPNAVAVIVGPQQGFVDTTLFAGKPTDPSATNLVQCGDDRVLSAIKLWQSVSAAGYYYKCGMLTLVRR